MKPKCQNLNLNFFARPEEMPFILGRAYDALPFHAFSVRKNHFLRNLRFPSPNLDGDPTLILARVDPIEPSMIESYLGDAKQHGLLVIGMPKIIDEVLTMGWISASSGAQRDDVVDPRELFSVMRKVIKDVCPARFVNTRPGSVEKVFGTLRVAQSISEGLQPKYFVTSRPFVQEPK